MSRIQQHPILIAGAGPSGLVTAIWLKTLAPGIPLRIISKSQSEDGTYGPSNTSRAIVMHSRTLETYRSLGFADEIIAEGIILEDITIRREGQPRARMTFGKIGTGMSKFPFVLGVAQDKHERVLVRILQRMGVKVEWGVEFRGFVNNVDSTDDGMTVQLEHVKDGEQRTEELHVSYIAACDGAKSGVRAALGLKMIGGTYLQRFFVADVDVDPSQSTKSVNLCPGDDCLAVFIPIDDTGRTRLIGSVDYDGDSEEMTFQDVHPAIKRWTGLDFDETKVNWFSTYNIHHRVIEKFSSNRRIFMIGDSAHLHSPVGGQGMNTGIGDATNIAWKIAAVHQNKAHPAILDTYEEERASFAHELVHTTDAMFTFIMQNSWLGYFVRAWVFPVLLPLLWKLPMLPGMFFKRASQNAITYRSSSLSKNMTPSPPPPPSSSSSSLSSPSASATTATTMKTGRGKIMAGDRIPWVEYPDGNDNHSSCRENNWHIQIYTATKSSEPTSLLQQKEQEPDNEAKEDKNWRGFPIYTYALNDKAHKLGFVAGNAYLIRPDGYIGYISSNGFNHNGDETDGEYDDRGMKQFVENWGIKT